MPFDAAGWPFVAEALAKPWPREAVLFDLRWWADRVRLGLESWPGRPTLARRWGWTDWQSKQVLRGEEQWADPARRATRSTSEPPAIHQPTANAAKDKRRVSTGNRQPAASDPPADRHARVSNDRSPTQVTIPLPPASPAGGSPGFDEDQVVELAKAVHDLEAPEIAQLARGDLEANHRVNALRVLQERRKKGLYVGSTRKRTVGASLVEAARRVHADLALLAELEGHHHGRDPPPDVDEPASNPPPPHSPPGAPP